METGSVGLLAPQLKNVRWIDENGEGRSPLTLGELGHGIRILYFFQDWCPGCHAHGFPTFVKLVDRLHDKGVGFTAIQTVLEGSDVNTFDRLRANQLRYRLRVPFGYAGAVSSDTVPNGGVALIWDRTHFSPQTVFHALIEMAMLSHVAIAWERSFR